MELKIGQNVNNYVLKAKLGEGGYGSVYKVENNNDKKE
jgi:serine/threonine protein kinase